MDAVVGLNNRLVDDKQRPGDQRTLARLEQRLLDWQVDHYDAKPALSTLAQAASELAAMLSLVTTGDPDLWTDEWNRAIERLAAAQRRVA